MAHLLNISGKTQVVNVTALKRAVNPALRGMNSDVVVCSPHKSNSAKYPSVVANGFTAIDESGAEYDADFHVGIPRNGEKNDNAPEVALMLAVALMHSRRSVPNDNGQRIVTDNDVTFFGKFLVNFVKVGSYGYRYDAEKSLALDNDLSAWANGFSDTAQIIGYRINDGKSSNAYRAEKAPKSSETVSQLKKSSDAGVSARDRMVEKLPTGDVPKNTVAYAKGLTKGNEFATVKALIPALNPDELEELSTLVVAAMAKVQ